MSNSSVKLKVSTVFSSAKFKMLSIFYFYKMLIVFLCVHFASSMSVQSSKKSYFLDNSDAENDVVDIMTAKGYSPNDKYLPKTSVIKSGYNDVTYLLSKLSDEDLIKLLNEQPKRSEYDLNDIVKLAFDSKYVHDKMKPAITESKPRETYYESQNNNKKRFHTVSEKEKPQIAFFRLENKPVDSYSVKADSDPNYNAVQKLSNMLYSRPADVDKDNKSADEDEKRELLFDVLVSQLKALCCKKKSGRATQKKFQTINEFLPFQSPTNMHSQDHKIMTNEHLFLIINDEIKSNGSDELISVDPDSLERNSSVLLLGPITTPLTDTQLKLVMNRISNELSKTEYMPLLQQLSEGSLSGSNIKLMKSLVTGPETRRYIKPHRCNHQSRLARVYGGPKWLICTGYLNLNTPSLYD